MLIVAEYGAREWRVFPSYYAISVTEMLLVALNCVFSMFFLFTTVFAV